MLSASLTANTNLNAKYLDFGFTVSIISLFSLLFEDKNYLKICALALKRLRQRDCKFEASPGYIKSPV
jgi:hypothetical protein